MFFSFPYFSGCHCYHFILPVDVISLHPSRMEVYLVFSPYSPLHLPNVLTFISTFSVPATSQSHSPLKAPEKGTSSPPPASAIGQRSQRPWLAVTSLPSLCPSPHDVPCMSPSLCRTALGPPDRSMTPVSLIRCTTALFLNKVTFWGVDKEDFNVCFQKTQYKPRHSLSFFSLIALLIFLWFPLLLVRHKIFLYQLYTKLVNSYFSVLDCPFPEFLPSELSKFST